ncbi:MAG: YbaB/EbfC family nucleoid-associated protein [Enterococcus sp.]|nr:YbaB/EbfC family nucleoid-associated protein [Enterococcus sp.]
MRLEIQREVIDPDDAEMLQDLIIACINEGMRMVDEASESEMNSLTGGLNLNGLF